MSILAVELYCVNQQQQNNAKRVYTCSPSLLILCSIQIHFDHNETQSDSEQQYQ